MNKTPTFNDFWRAYPLHVSKKRAESAWNRLTARDKRLAIAAITSYVAYIQTMPSPSYRNPQGWLNDRRWEDELGDTTPPQPLPSEGRGVPCGTKTEQSPNPSHTDGAATPLPSRGGAGVGSVTYPDGMDKW